MENEWLGQSGSSDIGLRTIISEAWKGKWVIIAVTLLSGVGGGIYGSLVQKQYRAEILISPVTESPSGGSIGAMASQYGALASLAGISLSGRGGNNKDESLAILQSHLITEAFVHENNLLPVLYPKSWNPQAQTWKSTDPTKIPTLWMANQSFKAIREVKLDKVGLVTLRITWRDPILAARWANELVSDTNRYLRDKAIKESERNIDYLNQEAAKTNVLEAKLAIYSILKDEVNKLMIAKGREEYALKVLDPAEPPQRSSTPSARVMVIIGCAAGLLLSAILVFGRSSLARIYGNQ